MKTKKRTLIAAIMLSLFTMMACLLPGMISRDAEPDGPIPVMETDTDKVLAVLRGTEWQPLQALAPEQFTEEDYAKPGTLTYNPTITEDLPTYFSYGWCAVDEDTLRQNFEHIQITLYINDEEFPADAVHNLSFTSSTGLLCVDFGALMSDWPEGEYELKAVATFDERINDGLADYAAGDYIFVYHVVVKKEKEGATAPSQI